MTSGPPDSRAGAILQITKAEGGTCVD